MRVIWGLDIFYRPWGYNGHMMSYDVIWHFSEHDKRLEWGGGSHSRTFSFEHGFDGGGMWEM